MNEALRSFLPSIFALGSLALVALLLTLFRESRDLDREAQRKFILLALLCIIFQGLHFAEEYFTGFHEALPAVWNLPPMSESFFVGFNLSWIGIWLLSVWAWRQRILLALFPIWFLALALVANGFFHPLLSLQQASYFSGTWTAPVAGVLGFLLVRRLLAITVSRSGRRSG